MKTIELDAYVTEDGEVRLKLPAEMSGEHLRFREAEPNEGLK